ncbi:MAG: Xaa-Pro peptidase family protein [Planctomycetales bacterium]|nr:Xaa-Pro peptidase family protein [Planctomycetales bacterium]
MTPVFRFSIILARRHHEQPAGDGIRPVSGSLGWPSGVDPSTNTPHLHTIAMSQARFTRRRRNLIARIRKLGLPALLVTDESNVTWLTGFTGDSSYLLIGPKLGVLISDTRYTVQIAEECSGLDVEIRDARRPMHDAIATVTTAAKLGALGFEAHSTSMATWERISAAIAGSNGAPELVSVGMVVNELRAKKDSGEIAEIRLAVHQAERGFAAMVSVLEADKTELEVAHELEHLMRRFGAEGPAFEPIVAVGPRAALPHARPGPTLIGESGFVLFDWGAKTTGGYRSDLTRVLLTSKIPPKLEAIYGVVLNAQRKGIKAIRPGATLKSVDRAARRVIENAGYGKFFGHGLGHGIGLDIHEEPRFSPVAEGVLEPGMVITVEPGIYLPGWGGVRIEDDVLVTRDGHEVLTSVPKRFEDAVVQIA